MNVIKIKCNLIVKQNSETAPVSSDCSTRKKQWIIDIYGNISAIKDVSLPTEYFKRDVPFNFRNLLFTKISHFFSFKMILKITVKFSESGGNYMKFH